jgi:cation:H+ antiporter
MAVLAIAGLIVGSATVGIGTHGLLDAYGLDGTLFGATIATLVLTIEDVFLTVEPARKGAPEIGVGNVIGSVVFSVTGKLGIILLTGGLVVGPTVLSWHLPVLIVLTGLAAYFLSTGRLVRWHGYVLLGLYVLYWVVSYGIFDGVPTDVD